MNSYFPKKQQKLSTDWKSQIRDYSPYLSSLLAKREETSFEETIREAEKSLRHNTSTEDVMAALRRAKQQTALLTAIADLKGEWDDVTVMARLSDFADFCVGQALKPLLEQAHRDGKIRTLNGPDVNKTEFFSCFNGEIVTKINSYCI